MELGPLKIIKIKKVYVIVEKTDTGFSACAKYFSVYATGKTFTELLASMTEALNLYFEDDKIIIKPNQLEFQIDLKEFFRHYRVINAKFLADRVKINPTLLSQYVQGRKTPAKKQVQKILDGIRELGRELADISLSS